MPRLLVRAHVKWSGGYLGRAPAAAGQRQSVRAERAGRVQSGHALLALVALVTLAPATTQASLQMKID